VKTTRLRVTLSEVRPEVQRMVDVPAAITLDELHEVLQIALGWTDSYLHRYRTDSAVYSMASDDWTTRARRTGGGCGCRTGRHMKPAAPAGVRCASLT
jgi:hypothetical protein